MYFNQADISVLANYPLTPVSYIDKEFVAGFLFRNKGRQGTEVALIQKARPEWQAGKWNGIGGRIESGESPHEAMVREFREEARAQVDEWRCFAVLRHLRARVFFFSSFQKTEETPATETDELIKFHPLHQIGLIQTLPNLQWLIPLAVCPNREVIYVGDDSEYPGASWKA